MMRDHTKLAGRQRFAALAVVLLAMPGLARAQAADADLRHAIVTLNQAGDIGETLAILNQAVRAEPRLGAAHLVSGDLLALMGGVAPPAVLAAPAPPEDATAREMRTRPSSDLVELRAELRARSAHLTRGPDQLPLNVLAMGQGINHVLLVDVNGPRVFLLGRRGNGLGVEGEFYTSVGVRGGGKSQAGDLRTPLGAYRIRKELPSSRLQRYHGAFAWVLNYPNADDLAEGRTGSNIWIHGTPPGTVARPPYSTEGCVALGNEDLWTLRRRIRIERTLVVVVEDVVWSSRRNWQTARARALVAARQQAAEARVARPREVQPPVERGSIVALRPSSEVLMVHDAAARSSVVPVAIVTAAATRPVTP